MFHEARKVGYPYKQNKFCLKFVLSLFCKDLKKEDTFSKSGDFFCSFLSGVSILLVEQIKNDDDPFKNAP